MALSLFTDPFLSDFERTFVDPFFFTTDVSFPTGTTGTTGRGQPTTGGAFGGAAQGPWHPMDVVEHEDRYTIVTDVPGMTPEDIHVEMQDQNTLLVRGRKSRGHREPEKGIRTYRQERTFNRFSRRFTLPDDALADGITARVEHGVLFVDIPKIARESRAGKQRIQVMGGTGTSPTGATTTTTAGTAGMAGTAGGGMATPGMATAGGGATAAGTTGTVPVTST